MTTIKTAARHLAASLAAVALAAGMLALAGTAARAGSRAPASCSSGSTGYSVYWKQPGHATVWFVTGDAGRSHPAECMHIRAKVESNQQHSAGFGARYYSGWIAARYKADGSRLTARASVPVQGDGSGVYKAWEQREWSNGTHRQQREIYPSRGSWGSAPAAAVHTTALVQSSRRCDEGRYWQGNDGGCDAAPLQAAPAV